MECVAFHSPGNLPNPGIESRSPTLQADSLPVEPQGKPKNTGVGSLSLFQQIFILTPNFIFIIYARFLKEQPPRGIRFRLHQSWTYPHLEVLLWLAAGVFELNALCSPDFSPLFISPALVIIALEKR